MIRLIRNLLLSNPAKTVFKKFLYFFLLGFTSCIDPFKADVDEGSSILSMEGYITTAPGPHQIKLTRTATYGDVFRDFIRPETQANVAIRENETGLVVFLNETQRGVYETPQDFSAKLGYRYSLLITTSEGNEYTSFPSLVNDVPQLDSLSYLTITIPTGDRLNPRSGIQLIAHFQDPPDELNYYFWNIKNPVSTVETFPEFYRPPRSLPTDPYQPKDCCKYCNIPGYSVSRALFLADDVNFNGLPTSQIAGYVEDDGFRLSFKYRFLFEQLAISSETFRYLNLINQQMTLSGGVFDLPPANIRGNIVNISNPDETVLGHFFAAGVSSKQVTLEGAKLNLLQIQRAFNDDCRELPNSVESEDWFQD